MAKKDKSLEDLDAELARLEAELKALEGGKAAPPPPKEGRREQRPGPPAASLPTPRAEKSRMPGIPKIGLGGLGKLKLPSKRAEPQAPAPPIPPPAEDIEVEILREDGERQDSRPAPLPSPEARPASQTRRSPPAPAFTPDPATSWRREGRIWRREPVASRPVYERRRLDAEGNVVEEGPAEPADFGLAPEKPPGFLARLAEQAQEPRQERSGLKRMLGGGKLPPILAGRTRTGGPKPVDAVPSTASEGKPAASRFNLASKLPKMGRKRAKPEEAPPGVPLESMPPADPGKTRRPKKRRGFVVLAALIVVLLLVTMVVLPAGIGVDPTGVGSRLGLVREGGSGGGAGGFSPFAPPTPIPKIRVAATTVATGAETQFDASDSIDPAGSGLTFTWSFGDGSTDATGAIVTHVFETKGTFEVKLAARSGKGATATASQAIAVLAAPVAAITALVNNSAISATNPAFNKDSQVAFSASGSSSENGGITSYGWRFSDGSTSAGVEFTKAFDAFGAIEVELIVTDAAGLEGTAKMRIPISFRETKAGDAPTSQDAPSTTTETFSVFESSALGYTPARVRVLLDFNPALATDSTVVTPPGQVNPNNLDLSVLDSQDTETGASATDGAPEEVVVSNPKGFRLGQWTAEITRKQGGTNPHPYTITMEVVYVLMQ